MIPSSTAGGMAFVSNRRSVPAADVTRTVFRPESERASFDPAR